MGSAPVLLFSPFLVPPAASSPCASTLRRIADSCCLCDIPTPPTAGESSGGGAAAAGQPTPLDDRVRFTRNDDFTMMSRHPKSPAKKESKIISTPNGPVIVHVRLRDAAKLPEGPSIEGRLRKYLNKFKAPKARSNRVLQLFADSGARKRSRVMIYIQHH